MTNDYIEIARKAIEEYLNTGKRISYDGAKTKREEKKGVFVTLKKNNRLRGCIGTIEGRYALEEEIANNAVSSAIDDPRFPSVTREELKDIEISVDVLDAEELIDDKSLLDPKIYGVIVEEGYKKGLLLPNIDGVDTVEDQIEIAKDKAGIIGEDYKIKRFKVTRYEKG